MSNLIKLNLGCGPDIKEGYVNIDSCPINSRVIKMDIRDLKYEKESVDEIYARDVIEHLPLGDAKKSIKNWSEISKSGGKLFIQTICWDLIIKAYHANLWNMEVVNYMLFAGKNWVDGSSRIEDFHKSAYSAELLVSLLEQNNFYIDQVKFDTIDEALLRNPISHNLNIYVLATKK
jgi:predicted SAM-dependent methyltransferase